MRLFLRKRKMSFGKNISLIIQFQNIICVIPVFVAFTNNIKSAVFSVAAIFHIYIQWFC